MEDDRLVRRLGSGHAGEVFEAVIGGRVYALKLFTHPAKYNSERDAYTKLSKALTKAKAKAKAKAASKPSASAATAKLIIVYSFCQKTEGCLAQRVLRNYGGPTPSCFLSHPVENYWHLGLQLEMINGPTLDDGADSGTGAVTAVLKTEEQRRRVWERLRDALKWLHRKAKMVHGSIHGKNVILVRVGERLRKMEDEDNEREAERSEQGEEKEEDGGRGEEKEEEDDYMPVLIDFNHASRKKSFGNNQAWLDACMDEFNEPDRLLPMVALKNMVASQGSLIRSHVEGSKLRVLVCGRCLTCLERRHNRLSYTIQGLWDVGGWKYARRDVEIVQPMFVDALHVVTGILQDIEQIRESGHRIDVLKTRVERLAYKLLWWVLDDLPCVGGDILKKFCKF